MTNERRIMKATEGSLRKARGFTLIELMIAVLVAAILVGIAVPTYNAQTRKSRRTEAKTALLDIASREERYNSTYTTYSSTAADLGYASLPATVGTGYYQVTVLACATACGADAGKGPFYLLTATPVTGKPQAKDTECGAFTLDNTGTQGITGTGSAATCWN
jgi:type IV pilus assembly protein PilE